jgi:hypothetical protein
MSTLAEKIGQSYIMEDDKQKDKQISVSEINSELGERKTQGTPIIDITREQWFWDKAVMS